MLSSVIFLKFQRRNHLQRQPNSRHGYVTATIFHLLNFSTIYLQFICTNNIYLRAMHSEERGYVESVI